MATVLLVEDDPAARQGLELALRRLAYQVHAAETGEGVLRDFRDAAAEVVVLDVMLPGLDGFEVCRQLHRGSDVPVIMLTARGDDLDIVAGLEAGAAQLLEAAMATFCSIGSRGSAAWALNRYAAVISATGDPARAEALYLETMRLARETRQLDDEGFALEGTGEHLLRRGDTEAGVAHLQQALLIFQRLAMRPDADRVQARLAGLTNSQTRLGQLLI